MVTFLNVQIVILGSSEIPDISTVSFLSPVYMAFSVCKDAFFLVLLVDSTGDLF